MKIKITLDDNDSIFLSKSLTVRLDYKENYCEVKVRPNEFMTAEDLVSELEEAIQKCLDAMLYAPIKAEL